MAAQITGGGSHGIGWGGLNIAKLSFFEEKV